MGIFDFLKTKDINEGISQFEQNDGAVLVDVRTEEEYQSGHIPKSINIPLHEIDSITQIISNHARPAFCILSERRKEQSGSDSPFKNGIYQCEKYRWNQ